MRKSSSLLLTAFASLALLGCFSDDPPHIELGHAFNGYDSRVMDTTSSFKLNEPFGLQVYNSKAFEMDSIEMSLYAGTVAQKGALQFSRKVRVNPKSRDLVIRGTSGDPLTARGFMRTSKPGDYVIEFKLSDGSVVQKQFSLHNSKE